jgi:hypothetical protein
MPGHGSILAGFAGTTAQKIGRDLQGSNAFGREFNYACNLILPNEIPGFTQLWEMFLTNRPSKKMLQSLLRMSGVNCPEFNDADFLFSTPGPFGGLGPHPDTQKSRNAWIQTLRTMAWVPSVPELFILRNREIINDDLFSYFLRRNGILDPLLRLAVRDLRNDIPGPSDMVRFAMKECFDPQAIAKYGLQNELSLDFLKWMRRSGMGGSTGIPRPAGVDVHGNPLPGGMAEWADFYHWAGWDFPSNTQGYEMLRQLYPDSRFGPSPLWSKETSFSNLDMEDLQKQNDIPGYWRKRLQAISYVPLTRVDIRRMYSIGVMKTDAELYHAFRLQGSNDANAWSLVQFTKKEQEEKDKKARRKISSGRICDAFSTGFVTKAQTKELLIQQDFTPLNADMFITDCEVGIQLKFTKQTIMAIRHKFHMGELDGPGADRMLARSGILEPRKTAYLSLWELQRSGLFKEANTKTLQEWFEAGFLAEKEFEIRLFRLKWSPADVTRIIAFSKDRILTQMEKEAAAEARRIEAENRRRQSEARRIAREMKAAERERITLLLSHSSPEWLKVYLRAEVITANEVRDRLTSLKWPEEDIIRFLEMYAK